MCYYDTSARGYNRFLISEGYVVKELYTYFFNKKIGDITSFTSIIEDSILWTIIGFVFVVAVLYIRRENKIRIKKILVKDDQEFIQRIEDKVKKGYYIHFLKDKPNDVIIKDWVAKISKISYK